MNNATKATGGKDKATSIWTCDNEATLARALKKAKQDGKWGDNNPKVATWTVCVTALTGSEKVSGGLAKDTPIIKWKWQRVHDHHTLPVYHTLYACLPFFLQLKHEYKIFKDMCTQSEWGWDNEKDVSEVPEKHT
jgi:hypothetical protein